MKKKQAIRVIVNSSNMQYKTHKTDLKETDCGIHVCYVFSEMYNHECIYQERKHVH